MHSGYRTERRKHQRLRVNLSVVYTVEGPEHVFSILGGREFEASTIDLSEGGVALLADHYLPVGTRIYVKFVVYESDHTGFINFYEILAISGEICSVLPLEDCKYRVGVSFQEVDDEKQLKLTDIKYSPLKYVSEVHPKRDQAQSCFNID